MTAGSDRPSTMKAVRSVVAGGPDSLVYETIAVPTPSGGEILIAVEACGVNFPDSLLIQDLYQLKAPRPFTPGSEVCGVVAEVGADVTAFKVGDRVVGRCPWGGMAEYVCIEASRCMQIDPSIPADEAATFLFVYSTSYYALHNRASLAPGETVLVLGAGGGVGAAAVELAKVMGAHPFAAASSQEKVDLALRLGAADGLVYERELTKDNARGLSAAFKSMVGAKGVDVVFDPVGGLYSEAALRALNPGGRHLVVGFTAGIPSMPLNLALLKSCQIVGVDWRAFNLREPELSARNARELLALYRAGRVRPTVSRRFSLRDGAEAIRLLSSRSIVGKVVVVNDEPR